MPDTPALEEVFGQSTEARPGCGVPVAHFLGLCHADMGGLPNAVELAITSDYSQCPAGRQPIAGGIPLAYNGNMIVYSQYFPYPFGVLAGNTRESIVSPCKSWHHPQPRIIHERVAGTNLFP
jgi:hypothetical protein